MLQGGLTGPGGSVLGYVSCSEETSELDEMEGKVMQEDRSIIMLTAGVCSGLPEGGGEELQEDEDEEDELLLGSF